MDVCIADFIRCKIYYNKLDILDALTFLSNSYYSHGKLDFSSKMHNPLKCGLENCKEEENDI